MRPSQAVAPAADARFGTLALWEARHTAKPAALPCLLRRVVAKLAQLEDVSGRALGTSCNVSAWHCVADVSSGRSLRTSACRTAHAASEPPHP